MAEVGTLEARTGLAGLLGRVRTISGSRPSRATIPHFGRWLGLIAAGALLFRILIVLRARSVPVAGDGYYYYLQANQMAHGRLFLFPLSGGQPSASNPPAWVVVLTAFTWLGGTTLLQQQLLACVIGTATVVLVGLAGRRIAGDRAGLLAACLAAVYAGLWIYERAVLSETLLLPVIAVIILIAYRFWDHPSLRLATLLGTVCGLLAMIRSEQILVLPLLIVPLILTARRVPWRRRLGGLALACASLLAVLTPWTIYNLGRFQRPVLLSTGLGLTAVSAQCNGTYYGTNTGGTAWCVGGSLSRDESVTDSEDRTRALTYAKHHLGRLPIVMLAREGRAFGLWSPLQQTVLDSRERSDWFAFALVTKITQHPNFGNGSDIWVGQVALYSYWLLLVPALIGATWLRRQKVPIYPLLIFLALIAITVAATFGKTRFRAGSEVSLVLLAAIGINAVLPSKRARPTSDDEDELARRCQAVPTPVAVRAASRPS